jgi:hypothetical protein
MYFSYTISPIFFSPIKNMKFLSLGLIVSTFTFTFISGNLIRRENVDVVEHNSSGALEAGQLANHKIPGFQSQTEPIKKRKLQRRKIADTLLRRQGLRYVKRAGENEIDEEEPKEQDNEAKEEEPKEQDNEPNESEANEEEPKENEVNEQALAGNLY